MPSEFCTICKKITNTVVTVMPRIITGPDGKVETITVKTYHCESCRSFMRSEETGRCIVT
ncbi:MAG: hypothetical protein AUK29_07710 [Nitrospirae bacterium CG2_30_53_67]|nr:MAG: hypothetical protein AUK29_07710 [Nitrospirae bacterium CG2_30_53_67]